MHELARDEFRAHMAFLSDDLLEGRGTTTRGHDQRVPLLEISVDADRSELTITRNGTRVHLVWGTDFLARGNATNPDALVDGPVVFVGYGVQSSDRGYDDYAGVDVRNKIVAFLNCATVNPV